MRWPWKRKSAADAEVAICRCGARFLLGTAERKAIIDRHFIDRHGAPEPTPGFDLAVYSVWPEGSRDLLLTYAVLVPEGCW